MTRWKASTTHLLLSILVIGGIALAIFLLWYPMGLYRLAGHDRIVLIMLGIDIAAGPLLTLIVFKPGKKTLKFDLAVIALCQAAFLAWGLHTLWQTRPVFLLGQPDRFTLVFANEISPQALRDARNPEWRKLSWTGPKLVGTRMPTDPDQRAEVMHAFMSGGPGIEYSPRWYFDYTEIAPEVARNAPPVEAGSGISRSDIEAIGLSAEHLGWHPIHSRFGEGKMLTDRRDGTPLRVANP